MKLCKDCKHYHRRNWYRFPWLRWLTPQKDQLEYARCSRKCGDKVNGAMTMNQDKMEYCYIERQFDHCCGPEGKYWEAK